MAIGYALKQLRERRGFSLRELSTLSKVNLTHLYRVEHGQSRLSETALRSVSNALCLDQRERKLLGLLAEQEVPEGLIDLFLEHPHYGVELMPPLALLPWPNTHRPNWEKRADRLIQFLDHCE